MPGRPTEEQPERSDQPQEQPGIRRDDRDDLRRGGGMGLRRPVPRFRRRVHLRPAAGHLHRLSGLRGGEHPGDPRVLESRKSRRKGRDDPLPPGLPGVVVLPPDRPEPVDPHGPGNRADAGGIRGAGVDRFRGLGRTAGVGRASDPPEARNERRAHGPLRDPVQLRGDLHHPPGRILDAASDAPIQIRLRVQHGVGDAPPGGDGGPRRPGVRGGVQREHHGISAGALRGHRPADRLLGGPVQPPGHTQHRVHLSHPALSGGGTPRTGLLRLDRGPAAGRSGMLQRHIKRRPHRRRR
mmetsp:Transcript_21069/g.49984  ORF Transcript_21069/g.49984 Transcript_21069/m.49984 type:complete len:296 (-) Transcript_21069:1093-1980(-)